MTNQEIKQMKNVAARARQIRNKLFKQADVAFECGQYDLGREIEIQANMLTPLATKLDRTLWNQSLPEFKSLESQ